MPLALNKKEYIDSCVLIDPTEILANAIVDHAINIESKMKKMF